MATKTYSGDFSFSGEFDGDGSDVSISGAITIAVTSISVSGNVFGTATIHYTDSGTTLDIPDLNNSTTPFSDSGSDSVHPENLGFISSLSISFDFNDGFGGFDGSFNGAKTSISGDIEIDGQTVSNPDWYSGNFPEIPVTLTLSSPPVLPPVISFDHGSSRINEGQTATYTLTRSFVPAGDTGSTVHVKFSDLVTSAVAGVNYIATVNGATSVGANDFLVTFAPGSKTATLTVKTLDDHVVSNVNGEFELDLFNPTNATIGSSSADTTILNIDHAAVHGVTNDHAGDKLKAGDVAHITVAFSDAVTVAGHPVLKLSDGGTATYDAGASDLADGLVVFDYTVKAGQNSGDVTVASLTVPAGSSIKDSTGHAAAVTGAAHANLDFSVDTKAPVVTHIAASSAGDVTITLTVSEAVTVIGVPVLTLSDGMTAAFTGGSGTNTLTFDYHVGAETTQDLKVIGIDQSAGSIADASLNALPSTLSADLHLAINTDVWTHGVKGDFTDVSKWTAGVPGSGHEASISAAGTYTVSSAADETVAALGIGDKTATLAISGGTFTATNGTAHDIMAGTVAVKDGATFEIGGMFDNTGTISLTSVFGHETDLLISAATTLAGKGAVKLLGTGADHIASDGSGSLTNFNVISGAGSIGDSGFTLTNASTGVIDANNKAMALKLDMDGGHHAGNSHLLESTAGATLAIADTIIDNAATGIVTAAAAKSHVDLDGVAINGGTVSTAVGAFIETSHGDASTITGATVKNAGTISAADGDLTIDGGLANTGVLAAANASHFDITGAVTGAGKATIGGGGILEFGAASSAKVTFLDGTGTLQLDTATTAAAKFTGTIVGFVNGDHIDLGAIDYTTGNAQLTAFVENAAHTSGVLTVTDGTHAETLTFLGKHTLADFTTAQDVNNHVDLLHV